jgi:hypothetical protein
MKKVNMKYCVSEAPEMTKTMMADFNTTLAFRAGAPLLIEGEVVQLVQTKDYPIYTVTVDLSGMMAEQGMPPLPPDAPAPLSVMTYVIIHEFANGKKLIAEAGPLFGPMDE